MADFPSFIYGTAWKKERTAALVETAATAGFRAIDTANQPKHYQEPLVGEALAALYGKGMKRGEFFLQTKFTPLDGHDQRVPYDPSARPAQQVEQSFQGSLENLRTDYIDSYLLHGPYSYPGLVDEDWEVWGAMEKIHRSGKVRRIGMSNVNLMQLRTLAEGAEIKPSVVQNRCFASRGWDRPVRQYCRENGIVYEGFSLLTANIDVLHDPRVAAIAARQDLTTPQVVFLFAREAGMVPLTGTSSERHMAEDLAALKGMLTPEETASIEAISG